MDRVQVRHVGPVGAGASARATLFSHTDGWSILRKPACYAAFVLHVYECDRIVCQQNS